VVGATPAAASTPAAAATTTTASTATPTPPRADAAPPAPPAAGNDDDHLDWVWPAKGRLVSGFSDTAALKGIDIAGALGDPVLASAAGKVVYAGSGLRGYGQLIIIKHSDTYLSAYAHNSKILVKEGDSVARGAKIAEMGSSDTNTVKLHFEIRRQGKPIDPQKFLPVQ
jgi:lipoprotein NlpD